MPAAAPTAPPAAAPTPAAAPKPTGDAPMNRQDSPDAGWLQEAGAELEQLDRDTNQPRPPRPAQGMPGREKPKPKEEPERQVEPSSQDDDVINPGDEPPPKPAAQQQATADVAQPERPMKAPELRKAYEESKKRITEELEPKLRQYEARIKELETAAPKDTEQTQTRVKQLEERNQKMEEFLRLKHYEQSQEYQEKYQKPYEEAWERCLQDISQLEVEVPDNQGGTTVRKASDADITYLAQLPLGELIKQSNAMFGDAADVIREHVKRINDTYRSQREALNQAQKRSKELANNAQTQMAEQSRVREKLWADNNADLATKFPAYFAPIQGDEAGNKLLNAGFAFADMLFESRNISPQKLALLPQKYRQEIETKGQLSPELAVRVHAIIRNKAANHDRLARQLKTVRAELEEAKRTLAEYEDSAPPVDGKNPSRATSGSGHWSDEPNAELEELSRRGPQ